MAATTKAISRGLDKCTVPKESEVGSECAALPEDLHGLAEFGEIALTTTWAPAGAHPVRAPAGALKSYRPS